MKWIDSREELPEIYIGTQDHVLIACTYFHDFEKVSDKLPAERKLVLFYRINQDQFPINSPELGFSFVLGWYDSECGFVAQDGGYVIEKVTHWIPLPDKPKDDE